MNCMYTYSKCKVQQPDALQHNGMTNSETEIEKPTTPRVSQQALLFAEIIRELREDHAEADKNLFQ